MSPYQSFIIEISKPRALRKGISHKRKQPFSIKDGRINELYDKYFSDAGMEKDKFFLVLDPLDLDEIIYLLRVHFQIWIEVNNNHLTIFKNFPGFFRIIKEVNRDNHWFVQNTIPEGTVMSYARDLFGTVNRLNGIPLSERLDEPLKTEIVPTVQVNYEFIVAFEE